MTTHKTEQYKGYTINIEYDDLDPMNPREWDNLGTMVCFHGRHNLGDDDHGYTEGDFAGWAALRAQLVKDGARIILPLSLFDHSGISMYVAAGAHPFDPGGWDSGQVGFIFVTAEQLRKEYNVKRITKAIEAKATEVLQGEVKTYDDFLTGNVFGYVIEDPNGDNDESCWGFLGDPEYCMSEAKALIDTLPPAETILHRTAELERIIGGALDSVQNDAGITDTTKASEVTVKALREAGLLTNEGTN